jgi:hypothetical protein
MRKLIINICFLLFLVVIFGCSEDEILLNYNIVIDTLPENNDVFLYLNDTMVDIYNPIYVDVNEDSIPDLLFRIIYIGSVGGLREMTVKVQTLSTIKIAMQLKTDSICSLFKWYSYFDLTDSIYDGFSENYNSIKDYSGFDLVLKIDTNAYIKKFDYKSSIDESSKWESGELCFSYEDFTFHWGLDVSNNVYKGFWYNSTKKFLGIKYTEGNFNYYGWIMISTQAPHGSPIKLHKAGLKRVVI